MGWRAISDHVDENNTLRMAEQQERKCLGPRLVPAQAEIKRAVKLRLQFHCTCS